MSEYGDRRELVTHTEWQARVQMIHDHHECDACREWNLDLTSGSEGDPPWGWGPCPGARADVDAAFMRVVTYAEGGYRAEALEKMKRHWEALKIVVRPAVTL